MSGIVKIPKFNIVNATKAHTATLFFFHGSGSNADDMKEWVDILNREELKFPHIKIVYPSAPLQPFTAFNGMQSTVWFNRIRVSMNVPEHVVSIDAMCQSVSKLIDAEVSNSILSNRIVIGGFSMGGALSMYTTYKYKPTIAGCFAMSSFLNKNSCVYEHLKTKPATNLPPLMQFHGDADSLVPLRWGEETHNQLKQFGVKGKFTVLKNAEHELTRSEVDTFKNWISEILPEK